MSLQDEVTASILPGDDFYGYVNKKWCDTHPIPADKARYSALTQLDEVVVEQLHELLEEPVNGKESRNSLLAKKLYGSGMHEVIIEQCGLNPMVSFVQEIEDLHDISDVRTLIAKYHSEGRSLIWRLNVDVDDKNSEHYVVTVSQGGLLLPNRDYYFEDDKRFEKVRTAYKQFLAQLFRELGKDNIAERVRNVCMIEERLAAASNTSIENRDVEAIYNPRTFAELAKQLGGLDWHAYQHSIGLERLDGLIIHQPKFLEEAAHLLDSLGVDVWKDYFTAHSITHFMPFLAKKYDDIHFSFFGKMLTGAERKEDRYKRVIRHVSSLLPEPIGQLYVDEYFDETAKAAIADLVAHIQGALRDRIKSLDWMSDGTKQKALEKLDTFMPLLGYPEKWRSYESLELQDDYVANILAIRKFDWQYDVSRVMGAVNRKEWLMSPAAVNAYYWPNTNGITFPAAILQPPMFDATDDVAVNYGAIGVVIGHEIIHGFDDNGAKYDKIGNLKSWWTDVDRKAFKERAKILIEQFNQYVVDGQYVKGQLTLGENIADVGGVLIAYDALKMKLAEEGHAEKIDEFTPEQRFFLAQARVWRTNIRPELVLRHLVTDPHAPDHLRVNGVIVNVDAWYDAWNVTEDNLLYKPPAERVRIW